MRKTAWLTAALLLAFGLNANAFALTSWIPTPVVQEEEKEDQTKEQEKSDEDKKKSDEKDSGGEEAAKPAVEPNPILEGLKKLAKKFDEENTQFTTTARSKEFRKGVREALKEGREAYQAYKKDHGEPDRNAYAKKMEDVAAYAIAWTAANGTTKKRRGAMEYLFANHADSPVMEQVVEMVRFGVGEKVAEERFQKLIDENPSRKVKGLAMSTLASMWSRRPDKAEEVEKLYETIVDKYADVESRRGKIGAVAKNALFEMRFLAVGREAPDIEGEDIDGVEFKLSDYRGKIVLLDFWGNW